MAVATRGDNVSPCAPASYHYNDKTTKELPLLEDCVAGDELKLTSTGWRVRTAGEIADGIALKDGIAGAAGFDIGIHGEMDGFEGLTPGDKLYPDAGVDGGLNTTAVADFVARVTCRTATRIRYDYK